VAGGRVSFVHGGIDRIQGHAQGRLVVAAQIPAAAVGAAPTDAQRGAHTPSLRAQIAALVERARQHANYVEVLGYV
jgi:D-methionine transport system ATP-binding protein